MSKSVRPDSPGRRRAGREQREDTFDPQQVYRVTSNRMKPLEEGTLVRAIAETGSQVVVQYHAKGLRSDANGQMVQGLVPRTFQTARTTFDNNTEKTDEEYKDE